MSSSTQSRREADVDPSKTAKFLANLQRTVGRRDPDDTPVAPPTPSIASATPPVAPSDVSSAPTMTKPATPVFVDVSEPARPTLSSAEAVTAPTPAGQGGRNPRPRRRTEQKSDRMSLEVTLDPGTASRVVYIRVDKTLADRLALIAFQNKINGGEGPATINDIGVAALHRWLDEYEQAA